MGRHCSVYALASSEDGAIRYIGQTTKPLKTRLSWHKTNSKSKQPVSKWVKTVIARGFDVVITPIKLNAELHLDEIALIAHHRSIGAKLLNLTNGGDGVSGYRLTSDHKSKLLAANIGRSPSTETRMRLSKARSDMWAGKTAAERSAIGSKSSAKLRGRKLPEETRAKMSAAKIGVPHINARPPVSDTTREKLSIAAKGRTPANLQAIHASMVGKPKSADVREKISKTLTGRTQTAETNQKKSEALKAKFSNPESAAMLSERSKKAWITRRSKLEAQRGLEY